MFKQGCVNIYKRSTQGMFWTNCDKSVPQSTPTALKYIIILLRQILVYFQDKYWSTWPPGNVLEIAAKCPGKLLLYSPELNAVWGNSHSDLALFQRSRKTKCIVLWKTSPINLSDAKDIRSRTQQPHINLVISNSMISIIACRAQTSCLSKSVATCNSFWFIFLAEPVDGSLRAVANHDL